MTEPDEIPEGGLRERHADPLAEAELAAIDARFHAGDDTCMDSGCTDYRCDCHYIVPSLTAEIRRLRAQVAERWPSPDPDKQPAAAADSQQRRDELFRLCQALGVVREDQWLSEAAIAAIEKLQSQVDGHAERIAAQSEILSRRAEVAATEMSPDKPGWSSVVPTEPGWYWWRRGKGNAELVVSVVQGVAALYAFLPGEGQASTVLELAGEWAGPLQPPS